MLCWDRSGTASLNRDISPTLTGKISLGKEESAWPITPLRSTFWSSAMTEDMLWYRCNLLLNLFCINMFILQAKPHFNLNVGQVGQVHGGLMGIIQRAMVRSCPHVWFERAEMKDRHLVTKRWVLPLFLSRLVFEHLGLRKMCWYFPGSCLECVWLFFLSFFFFFQTAVSKSLKS